MSNDVNTKLPIASVAYTRGHERYLNPVGKLFDAIHNLKTGKSETEKVVFSVSMPQPNSRFLYNTVEKGPHWVNIGEAPTTPAGTMIEFFMAFRMYKRIFEQDVKGLKLYLTRPVAENYYEPTKRDIDHRMFYDVSHESGFGDFTLISFPIDGNFNALGWAEHLTTLGVNTNSGMTVAMNSRVRFKRTHEYECYSLPGSRNNTTWYVDQRRTDAHEIGHTLGLGHQPIPQWRNVVPSNEQLALAIRSANSLQEGTEILNGVQSKFGSEIAEKVRMKRSLMRSSGFAAEPMKHFLPAHSLMKDAWLRYSLSQLYGYDLEESVIRYIEKEQELVSQLNDYVDQDRACCGCGAEGFVPLWQY